MDRERDWFSRNRVICDVLEDMRRCDKVRNYAILAGLIEEAQVMANRMESALSDQKDLVKLTESTSKKRREYNEICDKVEALKKELPKPDAE